MTQSLKWVFKLIFIVVGFELAIVSSTIAGCFFTDKCSEETRQGIERSMNSLATKAFALYAAEKAGQANEKKKTEACPKCGE
jgi:hypothetical protein